MWQNIAAELRGQAQQAQQGWGAVAVQQQGWGAAPVQQQAWGAAPMQQQGWGATPVQQAASGGGNEQHMLKLLAQLVAQTGGKGGGKGGKGANQQQPTGPKEQGDQSKELLHQMIYKATGKHAVATDVLYNTVDLQTQPPQFVSHVILLTIDPNRTYTGEPMPNEQDAERSAARTALSENGQQVPTNPLGQGGGGGGKGGGKNKSKKPGGMPGMGGAAGVIQNKKKKKPSKCNASCKWCQIGTCWKSGQVEMPPEVQAAKAAKDAGLLPPGTKLTDVAPGTF